MTIAFSAGGLEGGDLQRVESAPGVADHPDRAGAPLLPRQPADDLGAVVELRRQVLVGQDAVGVAGAPHVHPDAGIAMAGDVRMHVRVAEGRDVPPPVGDVLEDRGNRVLLRVPRYPHPRRQPEPAGQRDPEGLDLADLARETRDSDRHVPPRCSGIVDGFVDPQGSLASCERLRESLRARLREGDPPRPASSAPSSQKEGWQSSRDRPILVSAMPRAWTLRAHGLGAHDRGRAVAGPCRSGAWRAAKG